MEIHIPETPEQSFRIMEKIDKIQYHIVENCPDHLLKMLQTDFWLGSSNDLKTWALFATKVNYDEPVDKISHNHLVAWLTEPPKRNTETIGAILTKVYIKTLQGASLDDSLIKSIISSNPFPVYRTVSHYLPSAPKDWLTLPAEIVVGFELSEGACLYKGIFEEYKRESFKDVVATLFAPRIDGVLLSYSLVIREVVPLASYEVDWPLARRGKDSPYKRSVKVQGAVPWEEEPNTSVLTMYQSVPYSQRWMTPLYFAEPVVRLTVAGNTPERAINNWHQVSRYLRRLKKKKPAPF